MDDIKKKSETLTFNSENIRGDTLIVTCRSSSCLSCEVEVSLKPPYNSVQVQGLSLGFFLLAVTGIVTLWILEESTTNVWVTITGLTGLVCFWLKYSHCNVIKEYVMVIKNIGIQIKTTHKSGRESLQFIDCKSIADVLINEAITMQKVIFYLAILSRTSESRNKGECLQLIPLFTSFYPRLEALEPIYHVIKRVLDKDELQGNTGFTCRDKVIKKGKIS